MSKTCLNISLDQDLMDFVKGYVQENKTTVADVITQFCILEGSQETCQHKKTD